MIQITREEALKNVDKKVVKNGSGKPFKSGLKVNTVKDVIQHPLWDSSIDMPAYTFFEDDSYVECRRCEPVNLEIERRFLLKRVPVEISYQPKYEVFQKYSSDGFRYRRTTEYGVPLREPYTPIRYYKTHKTTIESGVAIEDEKEITQEEFCNEVRLEFPFITKKRFVYRDDSGLKFEIDQFNDMSLVILEVELNDIDQGFSIPDFIKKEIIMEITGIKEFGNRNLATSIKI